MDEIEELVARHYNVRGLYAHYKSKQKQKRKQVIPEKLMKRYRKFIMYRFREYKDVKGRSRKWKRGATWSEMLRVAYPVEELMDFVNGRNVLLDRIKKHDPNWYGAEISIPTISSD